MHLLKNSIRGPLALLVGLLVLAAVALTPTFGGDTEATSSTTWLNLNRTAAMSEFLIPGVPVDSLALPIAGEQTPPGFLITINGNNTTFPVQGDLLFNVDKGVGHLNNPANNELMAYTRNNVAPPTGCGPVAKNQLCITDRGKDTGGKKPHDPGTLVQLATQLYEAIDASNTAGGDAVQCVEANQMSTTATLPFKLGCTGSAAAFGASGFITVAHGETMTSNVGGSTNEMMEFNQAGGCAGMTANDLCIVTRALQNDNTNYLHKAQGFSNPCSDDGNWIVVNNPEVGDETPGACPQLGLSVISLHSRIKVKSNDGFFPSGNLMVCPANPQTWTDANCELLGHNNALSKIPPAPISDHVKGCKVGGPADCDEFYIAGRGASTVLFRRTAIMPHAQGSIVTGAHSQLICREGNYQPGVDTDPATSGFQEPAGQKAGTSTAAYPICQTRTQPDGWPKGMSAKMDVPLTGQDLIVLMAAAMPFLSTGGFQPPIASWPYVPHADVDGTNGDKNDCDGDLDTGEKLLCLLSPCIPEYTPGVNLNVDVRLNITDQDYTTADTGLIKVVLDSVLNDGTHPWDTPVGGPDLDITTHDDCDDPAGWGPITVTTYSYFDPNAAEGAGTCSDLLDNDGDGKIDEKDPGCYFLNGVPSHDTDGDMCSDTEEGYQDSKKGGDRDAWNPYDFMDFNNNGYIDAPNDILNVMLRYSANPALPYNIKADVGAGYGPFTWNRSQPNGVIDAPNDITAVKFQYQHDCRPAP
ncbi:MAG: hypothetical protein A2148_03260 [Chloroflexi bacterium RBG_16_68_14]|nr:MAG: hypothetical protein A2148_03260 [Chloroflexi bacterium RBG_16_68_14]